MHWCSHQGAGSSLEAIIDRRAEPAAERLHLDELSNGEESSQSQRMDARSGAPMLLKVLRVPIHLHERGWHIAAFG
jgi:hypothetical protein